MLLEELRKQVIEHSQKMLHDGLTMGTGGNISARDPKSGLVAITPSSMEYDTLVPSDVPILDVNGKVIEGEHRPSTETPMHTLIYRERSDVMAIVHNHAAFATGFAFLGRGGSNRSQSPLLPCPPTLIPVSWPASIPRTLTPSRL